MRYEQIMFTKNQLDYYQLYEKISKLPKRSYSHRQLAELTGFTYAKVKYTLERIGEIIENLDSHQATLFTQGKQLEIQKITISLTAFRSQLLKNQSVPFQFLLWLLKEEKSDVEDFLAQHYISFSTLSRNIRPLQNYLKQYDIHLNLSAGVLTASDELLLRQSLFYLFWMGTQGETAIFEPYVIEENLLPKLLAHIPDEQHYVTEKMYRLMLIIQHFRLKHGHYHQKEHRAQQLLEANPLYDLSLCQNNKLIPPEFITNESASLLLSSLTSPLFVSGESKLPCNHHLVLAKKLPTLQALVEAFLTYFETKIFQEKIPSHLRATLQVNMLQAAAGIWVFQGSFPNLHYFLVQENRQNPASVHYEEEIRSFFRSDKTPSFLTYRAYFPTLEKSFGHILQPYYVQKMSWTKLKVAIAIEPNSILYDKLDLVLSSIYFVQIEVFMANQAKEYDLVITSIASFSQDFPEIPHLLWNIVTPDEELPYLFYTLRDLYHNKKNKLRFI
ncbi:helix-turn-helix domain-containing protein [Enterococcus sp. 2201sp1_2201st1_B8_2201SCRN_220225]|uniref:helix-turn-helix domain-containing protein n=1 Tax=unclassified Enterococcus TaxID=2608891 RepID=UPI0034A552C0